MVIFSNNRTSLDDYLWQMNGVITKKGIDKFLYEYRGKYELLFSKFQLAVRIIK